MTRVQEAAAAAFVRSRYGGTDVRPLAGGTWSDAFGFDVGGERLVIRFGGSRDEYGKDRLAGSWSSTELPIPEVIEVGDALDSTFAVSRFVPGRPLDGLDAAGWERCIPALLDALDALRRVRLPGAGFGWFDERGVAGATTWRDWLRATLQGPGDDRVAGFRDAMAAHPGSLERYEHGRTRLEGMLDDCPDVRHAVHTDLGAGNTLVDGDRIGGIIDWANAIAGDPLYDLAHLTFWAPWHPGCPEAQLRGAAAERFDEPGFDERLLVYELHISLVESRFNAVMHRPAMLDGVAARAEQLLEGRSDR